VPTAKSWKPIALLLLLTSSPACRCDCEAEIDIELPTPVAGVAQSLQVQFRHGDATEPQITCDWDAATGSSGAWTCMPTARDVTVQTGTAALSRFTYQGADLSSAWSIELKGPTGSQSLTRQPRDTDPGEGYPGSCVCYPYRIFITSDELLAVGAVLP
jgi:hypothetical protein